MEFLRRSLPIVPGVAQEYVAQVLCSARFNAFADGRQGTNLKVGIHNGRARARPPRLGGTTGSRRTA
jgi:hypothetical protein